MELPKNCSSLQRAEAKPSPTFSQQLEVRETIRMNQSSLSVLLSGGMPLQKALEGLMGAEGVGLIFTEQVRVKSKNCSLIAQDWATLGSLGDLASQIQD